MEWYTWHKTELVVAGPKVGFAVIIAEVALPVGSAV